ncbi:RidA family protein [Methanobacterium sp.]|uniref:RidA family protein n=1 Tax=Methanobacterium sp. TaxID=2164 RepID=UPI0025F2D194|nr:RidA family protein [Methanobacterium sp.]MBI5458731.1 RidA family protein [Methanobacterium sp.]
MKKIDYINPENMAKPRGYSHAISVTGNHQTIYIGGQNAVDENRALVGKDSLKKQTEQVLTNIEKILEESDAKLENVVKFNIYLVPGQNPQDGFQVFQEKWGNNPNYPAITVLFVAGLGNPDWLVEIDAMAIIPE